MNGEQSIQTLLTIGENIVVEFKRAGDGPGHDTYETICAFLNRQGGDILLGVDADIVVRGTSPIADMFIRKREIFTEQRVFPYVTKSDLRLDLLPRIRIMAQTAHNGSHPWAKADDDAILRSAKLFGTDAATGREGFNAAAILLLGKDDTIGNCFPAYKTDALLRRVNIDRYDDRVTVYTNLIEAFDRLMEFGEKHLDDKFYLEGIQRVSLRNNILREMLGNLLAHREFSSSLTARFIIERDRMFTENANKAINPGFITPANLKPYSKNPIIAKFFHEIGRADELGSGVRNLYRDVRLYSGADPVFDEEDIFRLTVPLNPEFSPTKATIRSQKPSINSEKQSIGREKPSVDASKESIQTWLAPLNLTKPTRKNIERLFNTVGTTEVFGRSRVMRIVELSNGPAGELIRAMLRHRLLDVVTGQGKGKYRFSHVFSTPSRSSSEEVGE